MAAIKDVILDDWMAAIKDDLREHAQKQAVPKNVMYQVRRQLRELEPQHYTAKEFSFGLFNRPLRDALKTRGDKLKISVVSNVLRIMGMNEDNWGDLCEEVVPNPTELQNHYDHAGRKPLFSLRDVQSVLTLDAIFLVFFCGCVYSEHFAELKLVKPVGQEIFFAVQPALLELLLQDIFLIENQIPLSLFQSTLQILLRKIGGRPNSSLDPIRARNGTGSLDKTETLDHLADKIVHGICTDMVQSWKLPGYCDELRKQAGCMQFFKIVHGICTAMGQSCNLPGHGADLSKRAGGTQFKDCKHFLDCRYRMMCQGLQVQGEGSTREHTDTDVNNIPSASQLDKAGIKILGRKGSFHDVKFIPRRVKGTLHLPTLKVGHGTEEIWRNLVAYEDMGYDYVTDDFTQYLHLMDKLVDSPEDVMVLTSGKSPVLVANYLGSVEDVVQLFNKNLRNAAYTNGKNLKWRKLCVDINKFYYYPPRKMYWEVVDANFSKPWLTISVIAAFVLVVLTLIQTFYSVLGYYHNG